MYKNKEFKKFFNSPFTFPILSKIYEGYRPSKIAQQLGITSQRLYYYTDSLVKGGCIIKVRSSDQTEGMAWRLTGKGQFILKEKLRRSVNSCNKTYGIAPIRLHNVSFAFKIKSFTQSPSRLRWNMIKNGVSKCNITYRDHTIELTKSGREWASVMGIHLPEQYLFDPFKGIIAQYNKARSFARLAAQRLRLVISEDGQLIKSPHMAFERDLIAMFLTRFQTAEARLQNGRRVWIDSSNGIGEFETDDPEYVYLYLLMPKIVNDIYEISGRMDRRSHSYARWYHPCLMEEN